MMYSKHQYRKINDQKHLKKIKKNWVVVSIAMLGMITGAMIGIKDNVAHADTTNPTSKAAAPTSVSSSATSSGSPASVSSATSSVSSNSDSNSSIAQSSSVSNESNSIYTKSLSSAAISDTASQSSSVASQIAATSDSNVTIAGSLAAQASVEHPMGKDNYNQYSLLLNNDTAKNGKASNINQGTNINIDIDQAAKNSITVNKLDYDSTLFKVKNDENGNYTFTTIKNIPPLSTTINLGFVANDPGYNWDGKDNAENPAVAPVIIKASGNNGVWTTPDQAVYVKPIPKQISYGGQGNGYMIGGNNNDKSIGDLLNFVTENKNFPYSNVKDAYLGYGYNGVPNFYDASKAKLSDGSYFITNILRTNRGSQNVLLQMTSPDYKFDLNNTKLVMQYINNDDYAKSNDIDITNASGVNIDANDHQINVDVSKFDKYRDGIMSLLTFVKIPAGVNPASIQVPVTGYHTWTDNGNVSQTSSDTLPHVGYLLQSGTVQNPFFTGKKTYNYVLTPGKNTETFDNNSLHAVKVDYNVPNNYFPFYVTPADDATAKQFPASRFPIADSGKYGFDGVDLTFDEDQLDKNNAFDANNNATLKFNLTTAPYNDAGGQSHTDSGVLTFNVHKVIDSVNIVYVDHTDNNKNLKTVNANVSKEGQVIPYSSSDDLREFQNQHYQLMNNEYDANQTPTYNGTTAYYIYLQHQFQAGDTDSTSMLTDSKLNLNELNATLTDQITGKTYQLSNPIQVSGLDSRVPGVKTVTYKYGAPTSQKIQIESVPTSSGKVYVSKFNTKDIDLIAGPKTRWVPGEGVVDLVDANGKSVDLNTLSIKGDKVNPAIPGTYHVQYTYNDELHHQFTRLVNVVVSASKANLLAHDVTLVAGNDTKWMPADGFTSATDENGHALSLNQIKVTGQNAMKLNVVGKYDINYSYMDGAGNVHSAISHVNVVAAPITPAQPTTNHIGATTSSSDSFAASFSSSSVVSSTPSSTNSMATNSSSIDTYPHHGKRPVMHQKHAVKGFKGQRIYNVDAIYTYQKPTFKFRIRKQFFKRTSRIKRAMFKVIGVTKSKFGRNRLLVIKINSKTNRVMKKIAKNMGYVTARCEYVKPLYYRTINKHSKYRVIQKLYEYKNMNLTGKKHLIKTHNLIHVNAIKKLGTVYRMKLNNGNYVTANKRYVILDKYYH